MDNLYTLEPKLGYQEVDSMADKKLVGKITHYFSKIGVAVIKVEGKINIGDRISIEGSTTNFEQEVGSMQIDRKDIRAASKGDDIGMKVKEPVREGDMIYKLAGK
jgi:translation elongation factor EF-1alpha